MAAKTKKRAAKQVEWVGGAVRLPSYVTDEGEPYRPAAVVWLSPAGVLGMEVFGRDWDPAQVVASFEATTRKPLVGRPHAPDRLRVASPELAAALREALGPDVDVIHAPTPELDVLMAALQQQIAQAPDDDEDDEDATYFTPGITAEALASFFRTAARLYRATPWRVVPDDSCLIGVTVASLGVRDAVVSVVGQLGESFGFICFSSVADFEAFLDAAEAMEAGGPPPKLPPHIALNFDRGADVPEVQRKEIATHGWEVAGANAYPWIAPVDEDAVLRPPTLADVTRVEAIAGALARLVESEPDLRRAWDRTEPFVRAFVVDTHAGPVEVALAVLPAPSLDDAPFDVHAPLFDATGELDEDFFEAYRDELLDRFAASPEARALPDGVDHAPLLLDYAARHLGLTPATLTPSAVREIVFEIIPAKLVCKPEIAGSIVAELRAFFAFLGREFALPNAEPCRAVLECDAAQRLERALSEPGKFGMGKSLLMAGEQAGFDIFTQEGMQAWMSEVQKRPLRPPPAKPAAPSRAKKDQRKAARKARKKNR